ncbi:MAG TPA: SufD family Fe-S cluster assembly protein, partial [Sphingomonas sp.]|nr:SufD family Fe-S cluster assembly protein [Sphingomonas sp.]
MTAVIDLPTNREEAFRWADMPALQAARALPPVSAAVPNAILADAARLVFVGGALTHRAGDLAITQATVVSDHALARHASGDGRSIALAPGSVTTIEITRVNAGEDSHTPLVFTLGEDAVLTLVETYVGAGWSNALTRFELGQGARVMRAVRVAQSAGFVS